ncbi:MAG: hypothetical protein DSZ05_08915 [Sulfurospirillum sp.]|nr:MAG: hypothetical protein DSZ05_08915 [Sulfurospirillum sp.]
MKEAMVTFFGNYAALLVFLHVLSAVVWVGGMIAIRVAVHPSLQSIEDPKIKLGKTLQIVGRLFHLVIPFIVILIVTATLMAVGLGFKGTDLYWLVHVKEVIWTVMTINFIYMYIRRKKAQKLFDTGDLPGAKALVAPLPNLLLPINIVLGVAAIFSGVILRGF